MIRMLTGQIVHRFIDGVVLDVNGVGYEVFVPSNLQSKLGEKVVVHIYTHVREEALNLFGFLTEAERILFVNLLSVSGVGPKSALHIIGHGVVAVEAAIRGSDVAFFQSIPRLGRKTAQKIIVDLQPKLGAESEFSLAAIGSVEYDVREALLSLGYDERSIGPVVAELDEGVSLEEGLKKSLQKLGSQR